MCPGHRNTSYTRRQIFTCHSQHFEQKFQLLFVNAPLCYRRDFSRISRASQPQHQLLEQIAFETVEKFCLGRAAADLPCSIRLCRSCPLPASTASCRNFLSRETSCYCWKMETLTGALSCLEALPSGPAAASFLLQAPHLAWLLHQQQCRTFVLVLPFAFLSSRGKNKHCGFMVRFHLAAASTLSEANRRFPLSSAHLVGSF